MKANNFTMEKKIMEKKSISFLSSGQKSSNNEQQIII